MKHKAKSFIAVLLALCLMMSLGVGALAADGPDGGNSGGGVARGSDPNLPSAGVILPDPPDPGSETTVSPEPENETYQTLSRQISDGLVYNTKEGSYNNGEALVGGTIKFQVYAPSTSPLEANQKIIVTYNGTVIEPIEGNVYQITMDDQPSTITARIATYYKVTTNVTPDGGGNVTVSRNSAEQDESITVTATANTGYELESLKWSYGANSADIASGGTFTMPASDVTVSATFKKVEIPEPPVVETEHDVHIVNSEEALSMPTRVRPLRTLR